MTYIISKNKNIILTIILIIGFVLIYKFSGLNSKAANSYSCNYYLGRCFVDNKFGKDNNKENCDKECLSKRYKYYFNKLVNSCVLDFRGEYSTKKQCEQANIANTSYVSDTWGCGVFNFASSVNLPLLVGSDRDACLKNIRPIGRVYECDYTNKKCIGVAKSSDKSKLTYESCWNVCMGQSPDSLPKDTLYGCTKMGYCAPNPSGGFKTYDECLNDSSCKATRIIYEEKTSIRYRWDDTLKKCKIDKNGEFESFGECRAVKEGIGSDFIYSCKDKKCQEKSWKDVMNQNVVAGKQGCYSSDCMNMGWGTHVEISLPEMSCGVDDKCLLNPESPPAYQSTIYLTENACKKDCEKVTSNN